MMACTVRVLWRVSSARSTSTAPVTYGAAPMMPGTFSSRGRISRQLRMKSPPTTRRCGSKPSTARWSERSKPVITARTTTGTMMPRVTPSTEMMVMTETKVRLGLR